MKRFFFILLFVFAAKGYSYAINPAEVRKLYHEAATKSDACKKLLIILDSYNETNNPLFAGYRGCATMMMANYIFNPVKKLSNFYKGRTLLEKSIANDKQNIELLFLRFTIQTNTPFFLNYKSEIKGDKKTLLSAVTKLKDVQLQQLIVSFLIASDYLTINEKNNLRPVAELYRR